jgi:hypothetical protein
MANSLATVWVDLRANTAKFATQMKGAERTVKSFGAKLKKIESGNIPSLRQAVIGLGSVMGAGYLGKRILETGAALEETQSKFSTVFGSAERDVQRFLDSFANVAGLSQQQAQNITATIGAVAQGMGYAQVESARFAEEITRLSGDLASFNNIPIEETSHAIIAALTGEREQLKRLACRLCFSIVQAHKLIIPKRKIQQHVDAQYVQQLTTVEAVLIGLANPANMGRARDGQLEATPVFSSLIVQLADRHGIPSRSEGLLEVSSWL